MIKEIRQPVEYPLQNESVSFPLQDRALTDEYLNDHIVRYMNDNGSTYGLTKRIYPINPIKNLLPHPR